MKAIATIIFIIFFGITAQAQNNTQEVKVETIEMTIVKTTATETTTEVARLYKFKNSRIKKELSFSTKRNIAKMA
jgi:phenolic acid decarboxylase